MDKEIQLCSTTVLSQILLMRCSKASPNFLTGDLELVCMASVKPKGDFGDCKYVYLSDADEAFNDALLVWFQSQCKEDEPIGLDIMDNADICIAK